VYSGDRKPPRSVTSPACCSACMHARSMEMTCSSLLRPAPAPARPAVGFLTNEKVRACAAAYCPALAPAGPRYSPLVRRMGVLDTPGWSSTALGAARSDSAAWWRCRRRCSSHGSLSSWGWVAAGGLEGGGSSRGRLGKAKRHLRSDGARPVLAAAEVPCLRKYLWTKSRGRGERVG
jgi:hypothetical protein